MSLSIQYGDMDLNEAMRLHQATPTIDSVVHEEGSTEPWISRLIADLIVARGARTVLETGTFQGATSVHIVDALARLGGGLFIMSEVDAGRRDRSFMRATRLGHDTVTIGAVGDIIPYLEQTKLLFDVAFVDDDHRKKHVGREVALVYERMVPGGLILLHDVWGSTDLQTIVTMWGGVSLNFPRLGPAGGLGIIQTIP